MMHWATKYLGVAWTPERNCWWLVREVFRERWSVDMPALGIGEIQMADNVGAIKAAAETSGWRPAGAPAADGDILLCRDSIGKRHVGVVIETQGQLRLLHNDGHMSLHGPTGGVVAPPLAEALGAGLYEVELWRRA